LRARHQRRGAGAPVEATDAAAARVEMQSRVVAALQTLPAPYLSVVVARFYDGLGPAEIARRTNTPVRTVETRLRRALARLRVELDASVPGGRQAWMIALLAFEPRSSHTTALVGGVVMSKRIAIVIGLVFLAGGAFWWQSGRAEPRAAGRADAVSRTPAELPAAPAAEPPPENAPALPAGPRVFGRVLDEDTGEPVAGARLALFDFVRGTTERAVSGADGAFALACAGDHALQLVVRSNMHAACTLPYLRPSTEARDVYVGRGGGLDGRVVDPEGLPIARATVTAVRGLFSEPADFDSHRVLYVQYVPDEFFRVASAETGEDGVFRFPRLAAGEYVLLASAPGFAAATYNGGNRLDSRQGIAVTDGERAQVEFELPRVVPIRFRVTDAEHGQPVRGVRLASGVDVYRRFVPMPGAAAREVEAGVYELDLAARADGAVDTAEVRIEHPQFAGTDLCFGGQPKGHEFAIVLGAGGRIEGVVHGLTDGLVMVWRYVDGMLLAAQPVDAAGRFALGPFAADEKLVVQAHDSSLRRLLGIVPVLPRNGKTATVAIRAPDAPSLSGRILRAGRPVPNPTIALYGAGLRLVTCAGEDGRFRIDGLEPGTYRVFVGCAGSHAIHAERTVEVGDGPAVLEMDGRYAIEGVLVNAVTNEPVAGKNLVVRARWIAADAPRGDLDLTRVGEDGRFRLVLMSPGTWELDVPDSVVERRPRVEVRDDAPVASVRLLVRQDIAERAIAIRINDAPSQLLVGEGTYRYEGDRGTEEGIWQAGELLIEEAERGSYRIRIDAPYHVGTSLTVEVAETDKRVERVVALPRADSVRVVTVEDGGAAKPAGMRAGDLIVSYNGKEIRNVVDLRAALDAARGTVAVDLRRAGETLSVTLPAGTMGITVENHGR
jgi:protocatechuate 3,4-dioxygenase beta subunit